MLHRIARINTYEYGEVFEVVVLDSKQSPNKARIAIRFPLGNFNLDLYTNYSVNAVRGVSPNEIAREVFHVMNFLCDVRDWKERMDEYDDFCDGRL